MENNYEVDIEREMRNFELKYQLHSSSYDKLLAARIIHVKHLICYDGKKFIFNLYRALFKREVDDDGYENYLTQLLNGVSKLDIIKELQNSEEGKKNSVMIKGLSKAETIQRIKKSSILRFLMRCKKHILRRSRSEILEALEKLNIEISNIKIHLEKHNNKIENQKEEIQSLFENSGMHLQDKIEDWDEFYRDFETQFRGSPDVIKRRCEVYIPIIKNLKIRRKKFSILDLACGRGEWLELLKENNFTATGVDNNKVMIDMCKKRALSIIHADISEYLNRQANNSLGAITGFHIIEHLPFITLMNLLDEVYRCLMKNGVAIFETPNPNNILVGSRNFYYDPTHIKPLPSLLMEYIFRKKGFKNVEIIETNSLDEHMIKDNSELAQRFNQLAYGAHDYAIVGFK